MAFDDPGFWTGIGAAGVTGFFAWVGKRMFHRESLEDRLQRWQEQTVAQLQTEVEEFKGDRERLIVMEHCLRIVVVELMRIEPENPTLKQVGIMLASALPVDVDVPEDMRELLARVSRAAGRRADRRRREAPSV